MDTKLQKEFKEMLINKGSCYKALMIVLQMARSTFYRKLKNNSWTIDEFNRMSKSIKLTLDESIKFFGFTFSTNVKPIEAEKYDKDNVIN